MMRTYHRQTLLSSMPGWCYWSLRTSSRFQSSIRISSWWQSPGRLLPCTSHAPSGIRTHTVASIPKHISPHCYHHCLVRYHCRRSSTDLCNAAFPLDQKHAVHFDAPHMFITWHDII